MTQTTKKPGIDTRLTPMHSCITVECQLCDSYMSVFETTPFLFIHFITVAPLCQLGNSVALH